MHAGDLAPADVRPLDRRVIREAARWLVRLDSGEATAEDRQACERWRASDTEHERAWQRAQAVRGVFGAIPPTLGMSTLQRPGVSRRTVLKSMAGLLIAAPAAWQTARHLPQWTADYRTATGEQRRVILADGTDVLLNTATSLDARISLTARDLSLHAGEIFLQSERPAMTPLVLHTPFGQVQADGAVRYAARLHRDDCQVSVIQGHVVLSPARTPGQAILLQAGRQARITALAVSSEQPFSAEENSWTRGVLHAKNMRLQTFVAELARYRHGLLRCSAEVADLRLSGVFQLDNIEGVLQALPALLPVRMRRITSYYVDLLPQAQA